MAENKAIRPEIRGLFDTIREHALKYNRAFENLEKDREDYEYFVGELKKQVQEFYKVINTDFYSIKQKYDDVIKIINIETLKTLDKYSELSDLEQLQKSYFKAVQDISEIQQSLDEQFEFLKKESNAFINLINEIKNRSNREVEKFLENAEQTLSETITKEITKTEEKLMVKLVSVEKRLVYFDQVYWAFQDRYREEVRNFYKEMDTLKSIFSSVNSNKSDFDKNNLGLIETDFQNKFESIHKIITIIQEKSKSHDEILARLPASFQSNKEFSSVLTDNDSKKFDELQRKITKFATEAASLKKSLSRATTIAILAIIGAIISILLAVLK
ncbi:MAG: hypothetical protein IAE98_00820 [Candidatus Kapabacteria bacterium]|nr:hypothetical protein [Candidatus Kapabacteria bacterium]